MRGRWAPRPIEGEAKGKEKEGEGEGQGREEEESHMVVRGGWAPPPMEGKGPREGQRMAIGQWAPLAADENNTPWGYAKPPPSSTPLLQQHAPPPPNAPQGRKNGEGGEETGKGEKDEPRRVTRRGRSRSPKMVRTAEGEQGKEKRERMIVVVRSPCQENWKIIVQMHTPARSSQCWSQQTQHGLGGCIWMHLVNGTGNSPSPGQPTLE